MVVEEGGAGAGHAGFEWTPGEARVRRRRRRGGLVTAVEERGEEKSGAIGSGN